MEYNKIVSEVREIARDGLRLQTVARFRSTLHDLTLEKERLAENRKHVEKNIARSNYQLSKIDPANPDAEQETKSLNSNLEYDNKSLESNTKQVEAVDKQIVEVTKKIEDIQSGVTKISRENLDHETALLLITVTNEQAKKLGQPEVTG